jgi:hypothetical protein
MPKSCCYSNSAPAPLVLVVENGKKKMLACLLPTRGSIHDMGPTLTHKKIILQKLIFEAKNVQTVCRETDHSPEAVLRYTNNFKQVLMCQSKGLSVAQTSFATKLSSASFKNTSTSSKNIANATAIYQMEIPNNLIKSSKSSTN